MKDLFWKHFVKTIVEASVKVKFAYVYNGTKTYSAQIFIQTTSMRRRFSLVLGMVTWFEIRQHSGVTSEKRLRMRAYQSVFLKFKRLEFWCEKNLRENKKMSLIYSFLTFFVYDCLSVVYSLNIPCVNKRSLDVLEAIKTENLYISLKLRCNW
jgi:hypothetical protein